MHNVHQMKKDLDGSVTQITEESSAETLRELILQKEDDRVEKVIAQMSLMKQIQKKEAENKKLEKALEKLNERKKLIHEALRRQKASADIKRKNALDRIEKQARLLKRKIDSSNRRSNLRRTYLKNQSCLRKLICSKPINFWLIKVTKEYYRE